MGKKRLGAAWMRFLLPCSDSSATPSFPSPVEYSGVTEFPYGLYMAVASLTCDLAGQNMVQFSPQGLLWLP